jgi:hypothetical protein
MHQTPPINFVHKQTAHCESGAVTNLLAHQGIEISEAMTFGIGAGLFFAYLPFIRINHLPLVTYRAAAGHLLRRFARLPGFTLTQRTFTSPQQAMAELDDHLARSVPVGLQTGVFWLPYFPRALRFHFNAHNLVVYGKQGNDYLISDPVFPEPVVCPAADLARARFASGALAPKGKMYHFSRVDPDFNRRFAITAAIDTVCTMMLKGFLPLIGVRGIRFLARRLHRWPDRIGVARAALHLGHVVRMQEEIGTGGGGFRYMFAAFLQESGALLEEKGLLSAASSLTSAGDRWRQFAVMAARICKERPQPDDTYTNMAECIRECAALEEEAYRSLHKWCQESS